jgi:hypothetical protein
MERIEMSLCMHACIPSTRFAMNRCRLDVVGSHSGWQMSPVTPIDIRCGLHDRKVLFFFLQTGLMEREHLLQWSLNRCATHMFKILQLDAAEQEHCTLYQQGCTWGGEVMNYSGEKHLMTLRAVFPTKPRALHASPMSVKSLMRCDVSAIRARLC